MEKLSTHHPYLRVYLARDKHMEALSTLVSNNEASFSTRMEMEGTIQKIKLFQLYTTEEAGNAMLKPWEGDNGLHLLIRKTPEGMTPLELDHHFEEATRSLISKVTGIHP